MHTKKFILYIFSINSEKEAEKGVMQLSRAMHNNSEPPNYIVLVITEKIVFPLQYRIIEISPKEIRFPENILRLDSILIAY